MNDFENVQTIGYESPRLLEFCRDCLRKVSWVYIAWLIVAGLIALGVYSFTRSWLSASVRPALVVYFIILGVHVIRRFKQGGKANILSPDFLFLGFYTLFHLGYVMLYGIGLAFYTFKIFVFETSISKSLFIVNLGLVCFLLGYEIIGGKEDASEITGLRRVPGGNWCIFGIVCMIIGLIAHLSIISYIGTDFFQQFGYRAFQNIQKYTGSFLVALIWRYGLQIMILGIVVYVVSSALRYGRLFHSKFALGLVVLHVVLLILEGDRGPMVQFGAPMLIVRHYFIKPVRIRHLFLITVIVFTLFTAMAAVRTIVFEPTRMLTEYQYQKVAARITWMNPFLETGSSFLTLNITTHEVPESVPYWMGASWRDAATHVVPFLQGFLLRHGIGTYPPSAWLTTFYYGTEAAGRGFTITAEGYLNFGYPGVVLELIFFGLFFRWLTIRFGKNPSATWAVIMIGCIGISIITIRNHVGIMFAACVRVMVVAALMNMFLPHEPLHEFEPEDGAMLPYGDTST